MNYSKEQFEIEETVVLKKKKKKKKEVHSMCSFKSAKKNPPDKAIEAD